MLICSETVMICLTVCLYVCVYEKLNLTDSIYYDCAIYLVRIKLIKTKIFEQSKFSVLRSPLALKKGNVYLKT